MHNPEKPGTKTERTLVLVHEQGFQPAHKILTQLSIDALRAGLERDFPSCVFAPGNTHIHMPFYGDLSNEYLFEHGLAYDEKLDIGDLDNTLTRLRALDKSKKFSVSRYDRLPGKSAVREFVASIGSPLARSLGVSRKLIARLGPDLGEYWNTDSGYASRIRDRVRNGIISAFDQNCQILLISHGTGSIVTYDVLWQLSHDERFAEQFRHQKIDLWLTLGAPLGDATVVSHLLGARREGTERFPGNIITWKNLSAEDDFLCHDATVSDDFKHMLDQRQVSSITDHRICNLAVRYGKSDPHEMLGYLIHPITTKITADWLKHESYTTLTEQS